MYSVYFILYLTTKPYSFISVDSVKVAKVLTTALKRDDSVIK